MMQVYIPKDLPYITAIVRDPRGMGCVKCNEPAHLVSVYRLRRPLRHVSVCRAHLPGVVASVAKRGK